MKSAFKFGIFIFILFGCSSDNDSNMNQNDDGEVIFIDSDGDGVSDDTEQSDGTDPNDGCSFTLVQQEYGKTTEAWRGQDCDGDGVTNGAEIDPDGNVINDDNGTDPLDSCSLTVTLQTVTPSNEWLEANCDNDCKTNEEEIADGTDPLNPAVFLGGGSELVSNTIYLSDGTLGRKAIFEANGTRIKEVLGSYDGNIYLKYAYTYDSNGRLIEFLDDSNLTYTFEYQNDLISSVTKGGFYGYTKSVTYNGFEIFTDNGNAPEDYFTDKIVFDPISNQVLTKETFVLDYSDEDMYQYTLSEFTYEGSNLVKIHETNLEYYVSTGEFWNSPAGDVYYTMYYDNELLNPVQNAYENLYLASLLVPVINNGAIFQHICPTCPNLIKEEYISTSIGGDAYYLEVNCAQENGFPFEATRTTFYEPQQPRAIEYRYQ